jgi:hypothetical protein
MPSISGGPLRPHYVYDELDAEVVSMPSISGGPLRRRQHCHHPEPLGVSMPSISGGPLRRMPSQGACDLGVWCPLRYPPVSVARKASFRRRNVTTMPLTREFAPRQPRPK